MLSLLQVTLRFSYEQSENDKAQNVRKERPGRGGKPHGEKRVCKAFGCKIRARQSNAEDGERVVQKGKAGAADGAEITAEAELETGEKTVPHIAPQILPAKTNDLRAIRSGRICEKRDDRLRKEYAIGADVHPSITSYLEIKPAHFYRVQTNIDGKNFVTARGWEDLSRMIRLYELSKIHVDKLLISQYVQDAKIAADFAQYYDLFCMYRSDYQVGSILEGNVSDEIRQRALKAKFDERLALIGLMLDALRAKVQSTMDENEVVARLMECLRTFRSSQMNSKESPRDAFNALIEEKSQALVMGKKAASMSADEQRVLRQLVECMNGESMLLRNLSNSDGFEILKKDFDARVEKLKKDIDKTRMQMTNLFAFSDDVFGDGQELLIIVTELTVSKDTAAFISKFGCEEYFRHNKDLLLYERYGEIVRALEDMNLN